MTLLGTTSVAESPDRCLNHPDTCYDVSYSEPIRNHHVGLERVESFESLAVAVLREQLSRQRYQNSISDRSSKPENVVSQRSNSYGTKQERKGRVEIKKFKVQSKTVKHCAPPATSISYQSCISQRPSDLTFYARDIS